MALRVSRSGHPAVSYHNPLSAFYSTRLNQCDVWIPGPLLTSCWFPGSISRHEQTEVPQFDQVTNLFISHILGFQLAISGHWGMMILKSLLDCLCMVLARRCQLSCRSLEELFAPRICLVISCNCHLHADHVQQPSKRHLYIIEIRLDAPSQPRCDHWTKELPRKRSRFTLTNRLTFRIDQERKTSIPYQGTLTNCIADQWSSFASQHPSPWAFGMDIGLLRLQPQFSLSPSMSTTTPSHAFPPHRSTSAIDLPQKVHRHLRSVQST